MTAPTAAATDLAVRGLTVTYRHRPALRGISVDAPGGLVTGVIGPNGAGKSTLLKAILGLVKADAGTVTVGGRPVQALRRRIAYLPQRSEIDWDYPAQVREVVAMGRYPHLGILRRRSRRDVETAAAALERVGLTDFARRPIGELSGGQQQRVFFARALAQQARLLLLDEPFAGVDAPTIGMLSDLLRALAAEGAGIVVVNHDLATVDTLCDRLVLLNQVLVAQGPTTDVLQAEVLARAYGSATGGLRQPAVPR